MNDFAPGNKLNTVFKVTNIITNSNKTVKVFNYPIPIGYTRDLLAIPGVAESDIRASLLKGELLVKLLSNELIITESDIDLLQFNSAQLQLLTQYGLSTGGQVETFSTSDMRQNIILLGSIDSSNRIFTLPNGEQFLSDGYVSILVYWNGVRQFVNNDYLLYGSDDNAIIMTSPPDVGDIITADYYINNGQD